MNRRLIVTAAVTLALAACSNDASPPAANDPSASGPTTAPATTSAPPTSTATPTTSPSPTSTASATATASPTGSMTVPVYYLGLNNKLFREFRTVPRSSGVVRAAVDAMLHVTPLDPDYTSLWPKATQVRGASISGDTATVDLTGNARTASAGADAEQQSVQQLVYTVTAAAPAVKKVRLRFDGQTKDTLWGHVDTRGDLTRAGQIETHGRIWITSPEQLTTVGRTFTVKGSATVFEATVSWSLRRLNGTPIKSGFATATQGAPGRGDWTVSVTIPASVTGDVVFKAWESSARDGSVQHPDDKRWHLR